MKKTIGFLLSVALGVCVILPAFAACGKEATATLTLSAGEYGTMEQTEYAVKVGENLSAFLADKAPVPEEGVVFGGWFDGETQLAENAKMPKKGLSLTARYKAQCSFSVTTYDAPSIEGKLIEYITYEWLGITYIYTVPAGCVLDETKENVTEITVQKGINVLHVNLNRIYYVVTYHGNAPTGHEEVQDVTYTVKYGYNLFLEDFSIFSEECRFLGWALSADGDVVYIAEEQLVLNDEVTHTTQSSFYRYLELYAKWSL